MGLLHLKRTVILLCLSIALGGSAAPADDHVSAREQHTSLTKRDVTCQNTSGTLISQINTSGCIDTLRDFDFGEDCTVSGTDVVMFMQIGDAAIYGINTAGTGTVSTSCDDVADAAQSIVDTCTDPNTGLLKGSTPTSGNPQLVVMIDSSHSSVPPCNPCF